MVLFDSDIARWIPGQEEAVPYRNARVLLAQEADGEIEVLATFEKVSCKFHRLRVVAITADRASYLAWRDLEPPPDAADTDRGRGLQTLHIAFAAPSHPFGVIEIRTRHYCLERNGTQRPVDVVFASLTPDDITQKEIGQ